MFEAESIKESVCGEVVEVRTMTCAEAVDICARAFSHDRKERENALRDMVAASVYDADGNRVWDHGSDIVNVKELAILQLIGLAMKVNGMNNENPTKAGGRKSRGSLASTGKGPRKSKVGPRAKS